MSCKPQSSRDSRKPSSGQSCRISLRRSVIKTESRNVVSQDSSQDWSLWEKRYILQYNDTLESETFLNSFFKLLSFRGGLVCCDLHETSLFYSVSRIQVLTTFPLTWLVQFFLSRRMSRKRPLPLNPLSFTRIYNSHFRKGVKKVLNYMLWLKIIFTEYNSFWFPSDFLRPWIEQENCFDSLD